MFQIRNWKILSIQILSLQAENFETEHIVVYRPVAGQSLETDEYSRCYAIGG
jgi:hypothetical protein